MYIYIHINQDDENLVDIFKRAIGNMKKAGLDVITNLDKDIDISDPSLAKNIGAYILDGSSEDAEIGYILASALSQKKHVLYTFPKGKPLTTSVRVLLKDKDMRKYLKVEFAFPYMIHEKVTKFLQYLDCKVGKEFYPIKYTLRLSPRMERYLEWKAQENNSNKAEFVRNQIEALMKEDSKFMEVLNSGK